VACPSCFGLTFDGAAFCEHCGAAHSPLTPAVDQPLRCPACKGRMQWVRAGGADLLECGACDGTWVEAATFERICADREAQAAVLHTSRETAAAPASRPAVQYRRCLRCARMMNRVNFGKLSGAVVDVCKGHGTFLDRGELHQVVRFIQGGGLDRARSAERERLLEEQRRLRDLQRDQVRLTSSSSTATWSDLAVHDLFSKLFER
jgi:Zn-finger nucleic acid-binding protein